ncbi:MAG TPA: hypothetical protein VM578_09775 [Candidatus Saccharimonadales bacterium]|nr:hypothetical protein [Candidatus Saccharimonadales bacterium]
MRVINLRLRELSEYAAVVDAGMDYVAEVGPWMRLLPVTELPWAAGTSHNN